MTNGAKSDARRRVRGKFHVLSAVLNMPFAGQPAIDVGLHCSIFVL
jgi:hypothetical protein